VSFFADLGGGRFAATEHTAGPWDPAFMHAGPPAALLGRALTRTAPRAGAFMARLTFEILGPVPVAEVALETRVLRPGRSVELLEGTLSAGGRAVMLARAWRVTAAPVSAGHGSPPAPLPDSPAAAPPALAGFGYGEAVELRFAAGGWDEFGPATVWTRLRVPLLAGEEPSGMERVLAVADSGNGVSAVLALGDWMYINTELTVHFRRAPRGEWICLDARTGIDEGGAGLATSVLSDADGPVAHGAQSLLVAPR
jgi:hypothetical protein